MVNKLGLIERASVPEDSFLVRETLRFHVNGFHSRVDFG